MRVKANGLTFDCLVEGQGPLVLLLHGFPQDKTCWRMQVPALSKRFRVVAPDLRGYGGTDKPPRVADYSIDKLVADVAGLVEALGEKKARIVGHDWGGAVAWATALSRPDVVERLSVLNCPHPAIMLRNLRSNPRQLLRSWYMGFFQLPWLPELLLGRHLREPIHYYRAALRCRPELPKRRISCPTRLIWGDQDKYLGKELTEGMEPLFSGPFDAVHLPDAGHWLLTERPERVNEALLEFLSA